MTLYIQLKIKRLNKSKINIKKFNEGSTPKNKSKIPKFKAVNSTIIALNNC
jgi:hypothetical protein